MAAKKQDANSQPSVQKLTATERTLLDEVGKLKHRLVLMEEAHRLIVGAVEFLYDLQTGKYPSLPEKKVENPESCRCHALPPTCGSLQPYPIANDSGAL